MPGEPYTKEEIGAMNGEEFAAARSRGFHKPDSVTVTHYDVGASARSQTESAAEAPVKDSNAWSTRKKSVRDFTCPSGQTCRLRRLSPEKLMEAGLLDRVTRLEGLADTLVQQAEGQPPRPNKLPSREDFKMLLEVLNLIVPLAVVEPKVWGDDEDAPDDAILVSDIDLEDRMAIMEEALSNLKALDRFRHPR